MRVFITGHKGFIGQNFLKAIPTDWCFSMFDIQDNPCTRPADLFLDCQNLDAVIHLGAISSTTETNVQKVMDMNLAWPIELAEICRAQKILFQFASSASVYGNSNKTMTETDKCKPLNIYAKSKFLFEEYLKSLDDKEFCWQALRYFNVYGKHEKHKGTQASPFTQFTRQAKEAGVIKIFEGSEHFYRDFIHVEKLIELQLKLLHSGKTGIFNIGTGKAKSFMEVARDVAMICDAEIEVIPFPNHLKEHYQSYTQASMEKTFSAISSLS